VEWTFQWFGKWPTRLPEAGLFNFPANTPDDIWMRKLGSWVRAGDVVDNGSQHQHGVWGGVAFQNPAAHGGGWVWIDSPDAPVISPAFSNYTATALPGNKTVFGNGLSNQGNATNGLSAVLFTNAYNTNYVLWYPFDDPSLDPALLEAQQFKFSATFFAN
jgi:hypothetical protein